MERSAKFGESVHRLFEVLGRERAKLVLVAFCAVGSVALNVSGPLILGHATDLIISGVQSADGIDFGALHRTLAVAVAVYVGGARAAGRQRLDDHRPRAAHDARTCASRPRRKIHALPLSYIDHQPRGDLLSRVTNDLDNLAQSLQQTLSQMLTSRS